MPPTLRPGATRGRQGEAGCGQGRPGVAGGGRGRPGAAGGGWGGRGRPGAAGAAGAYQLSQVSVVTLKSYCRLLWLYGGFFFDPFPARGPNKTTGKQL